jgi:hypothetical protein
MADYKKQVYMVHDNGGRPFSVELEPLNGERRYKVTIYKNTYDLQKHEDCPDEVITSFDDAIVWIGKSPITPAALSSGGHGPEFDGNSMLIQPNKDTLEYVFVGWEVFCFVADAPIVRFVSPVGNNDVPYPYAVDAKHHHYLLIDNMVLSKCHLHPTYSEDPAQFDPYTFCDSDVSPSVKVPDVWYKDPDGNEERLATYTRLDIAPETRKYWRKSDSKTVTHEEAKLLVAAAKEEVGISTLNIIDTIHKRIY